MSAVEVLRAQVAAPPPPASAVEVLRAQVAATQAGAVEVLRAQITASTLLQANAGRPQTAQGTQRVILDGSGSTGTITGWAWTQVSGPAVTITDADQMYASFTAPALRGSASNLVFRLRVTDAGGTSAPSDTTVAVARHRTFRITGSGMAGYRTVPVVPPVVNQRPAAVIGGDQVVQVGATVTIGGTDTDPDGTVVGWDFTQTGPSVLTLTGTGSTRTVTPTTPGTWVFTKTVVDDLGARSAPASMTLTVVDPAGFEIGVVEPTLANTGCRYPRASLTVVAGDLVVNTGGTATNPLVIERKLIRGQLRINVPYVTVRDCIVEGGPAPVYGTTWPLVRALTAGAVGLLFEYITLAPSAPSVDVYGFQGGDFTARYCQVGGVVDAFSINGSAATVKKVTIEGCYVDDLRTYSPDPRQSDNITHNDGIQSAGNLDLRIVGCTIHGGRTSCILIQQGQGTYVKAYTDRCWLYGNPDTGSTFNVSENGRGPINNLTVTGHRIDRAGRAPRLLLPAATAAAATTVVAGNVYMDDGSPVPISPGA